MSQFDNELGERLDALRQKGLYRRTRRVDSAQSPHIELEGCQLINFSSNDYLGLANHPVLKQAAQSAIDRYGAGSGASRLICGNLAIHQELDETLAAFKGTQAAISFGTGYTAALGTISALMGPADVIILDKLVHASIIDAARLSGATLRVFRHNDVNHLEHLLKWAVARGSGPDRGKKAGILVVTESIFSMDGDQAPLREIAELKEKYGAWLMLDEAHATGLYGPRRRGLAEELGVADRIEIQMGTLGKAAGAAGGYICGSRPLVDYLVNRARSFIFSTAPVPAAAAAARAGIRLIESDLGEERRKVLWELIASLKSETVRQAPSAIIPIMVGDEETAVARADSLRAGGIFIPAIRYPTVPRGRARLRLTVTAAHTSQDLETLRKHLNLLQPEPT